MALSSFNSFYKTDRVISKEKAKPYSMFLKRVTESFLESRHKEDRVLRESTSTNRISNASTNDTSTSTHEVKKRY